MASEPMFEDEEDANEAPDVPETQQRLLDGITGWDTESDGEETEAKNASANPAAFAEEFSLKQKQQGTDYDAPVRNTYEDVPVTQQEALANIEGWEPELTRATPAPLQDERRGEGEGEGGSEAQAPAGSDHALAGEGVEAAKESSGRGAAVVNMEPQVGVPSEEEERATPTPNREEKEDVPRPQTETPRASPHDHVRGSDPTQEQEQEEERLLASLTENGPSASAPPPSSMPMMMTQVFDHAAADTIADAFTEALEKAQDTETQAEAEAEPEPEELEIDVDQDQDQNHDQDQAGADEGYREELERKLVSLVGHLRRCEGIKRKRNVLELVEPMEALEDFFGCSTEDQDLTTNSEVYTAKLHRLAQRLGS